MKLLHLPTNEMHELHEPWKGCYMNEQDHSVNIEEYETPLQLLKRLYQTAQKMILSKPLKGTTVDILQTEHYLIVYSHTKGNRYNICGNHYKYYHDIETGEFIPDREVKHWKEPTLLKSRLLMADFTELMKVHASRVPQKTTINQLSLL